MTKHERASRLFETSNYIQFKDAALPCVCYILLHLAFIWARRSVRQEQPKTLIPHYLMSISITKSTLKTMILKNKNLSSWTRRSLSIFYSRVFYHLTISCQMHYIETLTSDTQNKRACRHAICALCLLIKKKIFSKDFSLCHTFPWGRLKLQNLPNKTMPQSKLADP